MRRLCSYHGHSRWILAMAAACLTVGTAALAGHIPFAVTTGEGNGADVYIRGGTFADQNFGTAEKLLVNNAGSNLSQAAKVYLRFDLSQVQNWNGFSHRDRFDLPFQDTETGTTPNLMDWEFSLYALNDGPSELFDEASITWNNAPGNDPTSPSGVGAGTTLIWNRFDIQAKGSEISFFGGFSELINQDTNDMITFIVVRDTAASAGADYVHAIAAPQEAFTGPLLHVPEPGLVPILVLGCAVFRRRRG